MACACFSTCYIGWILAGLPDLSQGVGENQVKPVETSRSLRGRWDRFGDLWLGQDTSMMGPQRSGESLMARVVMACAVKHRRGGLYRGHNWDEKIRKIKLFVKNTNSSPLDCTNTLEKSIIKTNERNRSNRLAAFLICHFISHIILKRDDSFG